MRKVFLVECVEPHYVCEVCSTFKTAVLAQHWYSEVIGKGERLYQIRSLPLIDSSFNSLFRKVNVKANVTK